MRRQLRFGLCGFVMSSMATVGVGAAADGGDGMALLDLVVEPAGRGPARARAADLEPRILGDQVFAWDGVAEAGIGWQNNVAQGEYVQALNLHGTLTRVIVCATGNATGVDARVAAVVYDDDGPAGAPGTLLAMSEASRIPGPLNAIDCSDLTVPATELQGRTYVGARWMPSQDSGFFVATDNSNATPIQDMYGRGSTGSTPGPWTLVRNANPQIRALGVGARVVSMNQALAPCFDAPATLCLNDGNFRVELDWRRPNDQEGLGLDSALRTDDSGVLYFFNASNLELLIKVLDACTVNNRYWVFYAATTNVEFHLIVNDTRTGKIKTYFNPLDRAAPPVQDTSAFATCP